MVRGPTDRLPFGLLPHQIKSDRSRSVHSNSDHWTFLAHAVLRTVIRSFCEKRQLKNFPAHRAKPPPWAPAMTRCFCVVTTKSKMPLTPRIWSRPYSWLRSAWRKARTLISWRRVIFIIVLRIHHHYDVVNCKEPTNTWDNRPGKRMFSSTMRMWHIKRRELQKPSSCARPIHRSRI